MVDAKLSLDGKLSLDTVMKKLQVIKSTQKSMLKNFSIILPVVLLALLVFQVRASNFKTLRMPLLGLIPSLTGWQNHFEKPKIFWMIWSNMDVGTAS